MISTEDIAAVNHVTQAVIRVGSKIALKSGLRNYGPSRSF